MNTETQTENLNEAQIPTFLRLNPIAAVIAFISFAALLFFDVLEEDSGAYTIVSLAALAGYLYFAFIIFAEQAFAYKEKGKVNWKPIGIILAATFLGEIFWWPLELGALAAIFYSERIAESRTSKAMLSFVKKSAAAATAGFFALLIFLSSCSESKSDIYDAYYAQLNQNVMTYKQRIYENFHHPFGTCTSAQVKDFNIGWNGDVPERLSYKVELFWNTLITSHGYTEISVEEVYNYNTESYETKSCEVLQTNGKLADEFWFDVGWGLSSLLLL